MLPKSSSFVGETPELSPRRRRTSVNSMLEELDVFDTPTNSAQRESSKQQESDDIKRTASSVADLDMAPQLRTDSHGTPIASNALQEIMLRADEAISTMTQDDAGLTERAFRDHYAASQFRTETWNHFRNLTVTLAREHRKKYDISATLAKVNTTLSLLSRLELYWCFPGVRLCAMFQRLVKNRWYDSLERQAHRIVRMFSTKTYRNIADIDKIETPHSNDDKVEDELPTTVNDGSGKPYFEMLLVDELSPVEEADFRARLRAQRQPDDQFVYNVVVVSTFEDAIIAVLFNHTIQSVVIRYRFAVESSTTVAMLRHYLKAVDPALTAAAKIDPCDALGEAIHELRPEVDLFKFSDVLFGSVHAGKKFFRRVFYRQEDYLELHLSIMLGIWDRYDAPFFAALHRYSRRPTGVFHALPLSRGKTITKSHWISDFGEFYGKNLFLAETSATTGGLDSLLQPTGSIKRAQEAAARAFGANQTFFVTNGTSTANKIVTQAIVCPNDIVLLGRDCHKSHFHSLVLCGGQALFLEPYNLTRFGMWGGVPIAEIKKQLFYLKLAGKLDRVKMLLLTNCTFDGISYHPYKVMKEVLAIKPDMVFLWDEAWFAFARATPTYRRRTAMDAAAHLRKLFCSDRYKAEYQSWKAQFDLLDHKKLETYTENELLPDPAQVRVRVYCTQSSHKTLTTFRQGSMIHIFDQDFEQMRDVFHEAYMMHTTTSPNYQILSSLDIGRRQLELEGFEFVRTSVGLAMMIRKQIQDTPLLRKYFRALRSKDMVPEHFRPSGCERFYDPVHGFTRVEDHWREDEFALDPTRITLDVSRTGMSGDQFRKMLSKRFDLQVNKTTRNTILLIVNIGATRGTSTFLLDVLHRLAGEYEDRAADQSDYERQKLADTVLSLSEKSLPLPLFSAFHPAFQISPCKSKFATCEGDMRSATYLAYNKDNCDYLEMDGAMNAAINTGRVLVSASLVVPYPPGFPILVPGQIISREILAFLKDVDVKEVHGYEADHGLHVFKNSILERKASRE